MLNEKQLQKSIDARLSGLTASDARRERIRLAVQTPETESTSMKKKLSLTLAAALLMLLTAAFAIAEGLNLFDLFGRHDARYAELAQEAILPTTSPVNIPNAPVGDATAVIDSAYFDGATLTLTLRVDNPSKTELYIPTQEELAGMESFEPQAAAIEPNDPYADILRAWNAALQNGTPFGYREWSVYPSDHVLTDDGIELLPAMGMTEYTADDARVELREFESPLPEAVQERDVLNVQVSLNRYLSTLYFDGEQVLFSNGVEDAGIVTASIPRAKTEARTLTGEGIIGGVPCRVTALVSPMSTSVTLTCDTPLSSFLAAPPEGISLQDVWVEMSATDESGVSLRPTNGAFLDDRTEVQVGFAGTGRMPETLTIRLYTTWEGENAPNAAEGAGILLR